jgi:ribokinase
VSETFDVVGVGACNADLFTYTKVMPVRGQTLTGTAFAQGWGGKNHNQVLQAAMLGSRTAVVSHVSDDAYGRGFVANFAALRCATEGVGVAPASQCSTGVASITVDADGGNCIVIVPGANELVTAAFVEQHRELVQRAKVLVTQLEVPLAATIRALEIGHASASTTTIFNPAPADTVLPDSIYALCDIVIPNETEAALLTGVAVNDAASAERAARLLLAKGAKNVIVTLGSQGCLLVPGAAAAAIHVPAAKVTAVDTTGAGDSFIGALSHCLAHGDSLEVAAKRAVACASFSVQRKGTQASFATIADIGRLGLWQ